jgi:hypothetical protein
MIINTQISGRNKENYKVDASGKKHYPFYLAHSFRQDIRDNLDISINHMQSTIFPIKGKASMIVDVSSDRNLNLIGVLKNTMDACMYKLVTDDRNVDSVIISQDNSKYKESEALHIHLLGDRHIYSPLTDLGYLKKNALLTSSTLTQIEDRYLPLPPPGLEDYTHVEPNLKDDVEIKYLLKKAFRGELITDDIVVSLIIHQSDTSHDLDNSVLGFIINAEGIVYEDMKQIKKLHLIKKSRSQASLEDYCYFRVYGA